MNEGEVHSEELQTESGQREKQRTHTQKKKHQQHLAEALAAFCRMMCVQLRSTMRTSPISSPTKKSKKKKKEVLNNVGTTVKETGCLYTALFIVRKKKRWCQKHQLVCLSGIYKRKKKGTLFFKILNGKTRGTKRKKKKNS